MSEPVVRVLTDLDQIRAALIRSRGFEEPELSETAKSGVRRIFGADLSAGEVVDRILKRVRDEGDAAVTELTAAIDGQVPDRVEVSADEILEAVGQVDELGRMAGREMNPGVTTGRRGRKCFHRWPPGEASLARSRES